MVRQTTQPVMQSISISMGYVDFLTVFGRASGVLLRVGEIEVLLGKYAARKYAMGSWSRIVPPLHFNISGQKAKIQFYYEVRNGAGRLMRQVQYSPADTQLLEQHGICVNGVDASEPTEAMQDDMDETECGDE